MSMNGKAKCLIAWLGLMAFLVLNLVTSHSFVLCFEPDGRVFLESAVGNVCGEAFQEMNALHQSTLASVKADHCQKCTDIPLTLKALIQPEQAPKTAFNLYQAPLLAEVPSSLIRYSAGITYQQVPHPPPLGPSIHRFLSTTVLLI